MFKALFNFLKSFWNVRDVSIKEIVLYLIFTVKHLILPEWQNWDYARVNYQVIPPCLIKMGYSLIQLAANSWKSPWDSHVSIDQQYVACLFYN